MCSLTGGGGGGFGPLPGARRRLLALESQLALEDPDPFSTVEYVQEQVVHILNHTCRNLIALASNRLVLIRCLLFS